MKLWFSIQCVDHGVDPPSLTCFIGPIKLN
jgi:hypothetical protein